MSAGWLERLARVAVFAGALAFAGCGAWLPEPPAGERPEGQKPLMVPRPPPPPQVELIPERPKEPPETVWIDGEWMWKGRRWEWKQGRWEVPPKGETYALPKIVYLPEDRIGWLPGAWQSAEETGR